MSRLPFLLLVLGWFPAFGWAQALKFDDNELAVPPTAARINPLVTNASTQGWGAFVGPVREAALRAYQRNPAGAAPWLNLYRWAALLATPQSRALETWIKALETAKAGHANMAGSYQVPPGSLAALLAPGAQRDLLADPAFSAEFFATLSPLDNPMEVLRVLNRLHAASPTLFADYNSLALAIAVVADTPPPPDWPHGQVSAELLPRRLPDPLELFNYYARLDRGNLTAHRLRRLPASELKFVVDVCASFKELDWARREVTPPLSALASVYDRVRYRTERIANQQYSWPAKDYQLATILAEGGICVDQAYFAATVGKARGVPTLIFRGAGLDGRHAWFGFLSPTGWMLDAGRYAEQRFIVGFARDPQTWRDLSDHELRFLSTRTRSTPLYRLASTHAAYAREFLRDGNIPAATAAAREATRRAPLNLDGWLVLTEVMEKSGAPAQETEAVLREAMRAFQLYPDLEVQFSRRLVACLRARSETSLANAEEQRLARKYQAGRTDLSLDQLAGMLQRTLATDDLATQIQSFRRLLNTHGHGANIDFYDKIVTPFVRHLQRGGHVREAVQMLELARRTLRVERGGQLAEEFDHLAQELRQP